MNSSPNINDERKMRAENARIVDEDLLFKASKLNRSGFVISLGEYYKKNGKLTLNQREALQNIIDKGR